METKEQRQAREAAWIENRDPLWLEKVWAEVAAEIAMEEANPQPVESN